jgi:hypothetical protein
MTVKRGSKRPFKANIWQIPIVIGLLAISIVVFAITRLIRFNFRPGDPESPSHNNPQC